MADNRQEEDLSVLGDELIQASQHIEIDLRDKFEKFSEEDLYDFLLPQKTKHLYKRTYNNFKKWKNDKNYFDSSEKTVVSYFMSLSEKYSPNTLWSYYSMLKLCINICEKVDIKFYNTLIAYIKRVNDGYEPKTSRILTEENMVDFLQSADDKQHFFHKVVMIVGVQGCLRKSEIKNVNMADIEDKKDMAIIKVPVLKTKKHKDAYITDSFYEYFKKYLSLRPINCKTDSFFLGYRNGKSLNAPAGINKIGCVPKEIAEFLKLADPKLYTSHALRRSSASAAANAGCSVEAIQRLGAWCIVLKPLNIML